MPDNKPWISHLRIEVGGNQLKIELMNRLVEILIDSTLYLPTLFEMRFQDEQVHWLSQNIFEAGMTVIIKLAQKLGEPEKIVSGEITAIEVQYTTDLRVMLIVRGYDFSHRLSRGTKTKVYVQMTDSDIVSQVVTNAGLSIQVDSTSQVHEHVFQHNLNDLAFLHQRAERNGYKLSVDGKIVSFRKSDASTGSAIPLEWGKELKSFHPRLSLTNQVDTVEVHGWDPAKKKEIIGQATNSSTAPQVGVDSGSVLAQEKFSSARQIIVRQPIANQSEAETLAQSVLDDFNASSLTADGIAVGSPKLIAGAQVKIDKIGAQFEGVYAVTRARHIYNSENYEVHFNVEGVRPHTVSDYFRPNYARQAPVERWGGVVSAIVTNNNDPKNLNRVKLKFPWLDDTKESNWARLVGMGAGNERGAYWIPEINDEVLVAFEHGDFNQPYVIGSLWNGKDATPVPVADAVSNGDVQIRMFKTRFGHIIKFVDGPSEQYIEIVDGNEGTKIRLDANSSDFSIESKGNTITNAKGSIELNSDQNITIKANANIQIEANGQLVLKGTTIDIN